MISIRTPYLLIALAAALALPSIERAQDAAAETSGAPEQIAQAQTSPMPGMGMGPGMGMRHGAMPGERCDMHKGGMMGDGKPCMMGGQHKGCKMGGGAGMADMRLDMLEKRMDMMQMMLEMMMKQQAPAGSQ